MCGHSTHLPGHNWPKKGAFLFYFFLLVIATTMVQQDHLIRCALLTKMPLANFQCAWHFGDIKMQVLAMTNFLRLPPHFVRFQKQAAWGPGLANRRIYFNKATRKSMMAIKAQRHSAPEPWHSFCVSVTFFYYYFMFLMEHGKWAAFLSEAQRTERYKFQNRAGFAIGEKERLKSGLTRAEN